MAASGDRYQEFFARVLAAPGWAHPDAIKLKEQADILAEIRRLREAAGEAEQHRNLLDMEMFSVTSVRGMPVESRDPETRRSRRAAIWGVSKAGVVEVSSQEDGGEWHHELVEQPMRNMQFLMTDAQAREAYETLGRVIASWGDDALYQIEPKASQPCNRRLSVRPKAVSKWRLCGSFTGGASRYLTWELREV